MSDELDYSNPYNNLEVDTQPAPQQQRIGNRSKTVTSRAASALKVGVILIIGIIILAGVNDTASKLENGGLTIKLSENPQDGQTFQFDDTVYEFDSGNGVSSGHIPVIIGATVIDTSNNLVSKFNEFNYDARIII
jgi:hypothetical protein